jgi:hypothetical protein
MPEMNSIPVGEVRRLLRKLGKAMKTEVSRIQTDVILDMSQQIAPGRICKWCIYFQSFLLFLLSRNVIVRTGGLLFEAYLDGFSGWATHKKWKAIRRRFEHDEEDRPSQDEESELLESERGDFHGFVLKSIASIGNNGKSQLFYLTFACRYHGLSRMGSDLLAHYGFNTKASMYDMEVIKAIQTGRNEARYV